MKSKKLWQTSDSSLHPLIEAFTVGDDYIFDQQLLPYDIQASLAHAEMLFHIGVLKKEELSQVIQGLHEALQQWENHNFTISQSQEDGHTALEQFLTEKYGEVGKKIHTGRSRNDQSLVMIRLYMKEKLNSFLSLLQKVITSFEKTSQKLHNIPMPGYTHLQRAMPTTVHTWLESFTHGFQDILPFIENTLHMIDQNPLGSASGFGIENFSLDRSYTTQKMGFKKTQENPMYCGLSRGYFENIVLQTLSPLMILSGRFACDMLLFTTQEFDFFSFPSEFTTGSSIMPQKRNYDVFEIMRGNAKVYHGYQFQIQDIILSIGSGYQRDVQLTKKPFILGINLCEMTLEVLAEVLLALQIKEDNIKKAMTHELFVTNEVYDLVNKGKSFREAYQEVKQRLT